MNGTDHYREAQASIEAAWDRDTDDSRRALLLAEAQVHATLALTAATIDAAAHPNQSQVDFLGQWFEVQS